MVSFYIQMFRIELHGLLNPTNKTTFFDKYMVILYYIVYIRKEE